MYQYLIQALGNSLQSSRHPNLLQNCLQSVEYVLLCMFLSYLLMGNV